jgi:hypothetical protein
MAANPGILKRLPGARHPTFPVPVPALSRLDTSTRLLALFDGAHRFSVVF